MDLPRLLFRSVAGTAALCAALGGCRALAPADTQRPAEEAQVLPVEAPPLPRIRPPYEADATLEPVAPPFPAALADPHWVRAVYPAAAEGERVRDRWRNAALEVLATRDEAPAEVLHAALSADDPIAAANAAILLARQQAPEAAVPLAAAIRDSRLRLSQRQAAIEALAGLETPAAAAALLGLLDELGPAPQDRRGPYLPELHAELLTGLARHPGLFAREDDVPAEPAWREHLNTALRSPDAAVRLAALEIWRQPKSGELPPTAIALRYDSDARVRAAALSLLAARRHPQAEACLQEALADGELPVRLAAIAGLGTQSSATARQTLVELSTNETELLRVAAVRALAAAGLAEELPIAAEDSSWRVRLVVAEALSEERHEDRLKIAGELLADPSPAVQTALVASLASWPLDEAGPLLLDGVARGAFLTRRAAAEQLAARWPPAAGFSPAAPAEARAAQLAELRSLWSQQFAAARLASYLGEAALDESSRPPRLLPTAEPLAIEDVSPATRGGVMLLVTLLDSLPDGDAGRAAALDKLATFGPELIPALGWVAWHEGRALPEDVYRKLLPPRDPAFAALLELTSDDASARRRAADELLALSREALLPPLAVERLAAIVARESDPLVWRSVLLAAAPDPGEAALRIAAAALTHSSADVRRRGCEHLAEHGGAAQLDALLAALADDDAGVVRAAVSAVGRIGGLETPAPLEGLLASPDRTLRIAAATALARLGEESGAAALERLTYDADADVRRLAAEAMGELADPAFVPPLVRLLDDSVGVQRAALAGLIQIAGSDIAADGEPAASLAERIKRWKAWAAR